MFIYVNKEMRLHLKKNSNFICSTNYAKLTVRAREALRLYISWDMIVDFGARSSISGKDK